MPLRVPCTPRFPARPKSPPPPTHTHARARTHHPTCPNTIAACVAARQTTTCATPVAPADSEDFRVDEDTQGGNVRLLARLAADMTKAVVEGSESAARRLLDGLEEQAGRAVKGAYLSSCVSSQGGGDKKDGAD
jgi:hypothetical protein